MTDNVDTLSYFLTSCFNFLNLFLGQHTKRFQRNKGREGRDHSSFSIITDDVERTLDLEVDLGPIGGGEQCEMDVRSLWVKSLRMLVKWTNELGE